MPVFFNPLAFFLKFFFYLLYNPFAWTYDWVASFVSKGRWIEWTYATLPYLSGGCVLELGHGPGHLQVAMNQHGWRVFGIDHSRSMGRLACRRLISAGYPNGLVSGMAQHLPFSTGVFDQIVTTFPAEFLFEPKTLAEVRRVLSPGGLMVVLPVAWVGKASRIDRGLGRIYQITHQAPKKTDNQWKTSMIELFSKAGFNVQTEIIAMDTSEIFILLARTRKVM